jgi:hypothetical protein
MLLVENTKENFSGLEHEVGVGVVRGCCVFLSYKVHRRRERRKKTSFPEAVFRRPETAEYRPHVIVALFLVIHSRRQSDEGANGPSTSDCGHRFELSLSLVRDLRPRISCASACCRSASGYRKVSNDLPHYEHTHTARPRTTSSFRSSSGVSSAPGLSNKIWLLAPSYSSSDSGFRSTILTRDQLGMVSRRHGILHVYFRGAHPIVT